MSIYLYNTAAKKNSYSKPLKKKVDIYTCGPTWCMITRTLEIFELLLFQDVLKKWLIFNGYKVKHVMNITDVDDKTIKRSINEGISLKDLTTYYELKFFEDLGLVKDSKSRFLS